MKKYIVYLFVMAFVSNFSAQDDESSNFRFGILGLGSVDWLVPDNDKKFTSGGIGVGYGWGLQTEFKLNAKTSLRTGVSLITSSGELNYADNNISFDSTCYVLNVDEEFVEWEQAFDSNNDLLVGNQLYLLKSRSMSISYVNIPVALKMKTNEIGYLTWFAEFGANFGFNTKTRTDDVCDLVEYDNTNDAFILDPDIVSPFSPSDISVSNLNLDKGTQPVKTGILIGIGGEFNFSGTTSLFFAGHFNYDISNAITTEKREDFLRSRDIYSGDFESIGAKSTFRNIRLTVGIIF
ncbi:MAG: outer membrane beta-barrel protein [Flavobacteriales bacterium]|nr:outer membrane beta-barrel protein [Flavobacteriales bacterium]